MVNALQLMSNDIHRAPELKRGEESFKADLYSFGSILFCMSFGYYPDPGEMEGEFDPYEVRKGGPMFEDLIDLLHGLLKVNPRARFDRKRFLEHAFIGLRLDDLDYEYKVKY